MKRTILFFAFAFACILVGAQSLYVGSYNIRNQNDYDVQNGNGWQQRCPVICDMINFETPDVFGSQEVLVGQLHAQPPYRRAAFQTIFLMSFGPARYL